MSAEVDDKNDEQQFLTIYTDETCAHGVEVPLESGTLALSINALSIAVHRANGLKFLCVYLHRAFPFLDHIVLQKSGNESLSCARAARGW
jgi:hypothetical protein